MQILRKNKHKQLLNLLVVLFAFIGLSACGGGSGDASSPAPPPPVANQAPNAVITVNQSSGIAPVNIEFSGTSSTDADGSITNYAWDFTSDGSVDDNNATANFEYQDAGMYTATLTVTDNDGASSSSMIEIVVERAAEKILFNGQEISGNGNNNLYIMNDDGTERLQLNSPDSNNREDVFQAEFSPDGQSVAYLVFDLDTRTQNLMVVSAAGGEALRLNQDIQMNQQIVSEFEWSPDSSQIAYTINSGSANSDGRFTREVWLVKRDGSGRIKINGPTGNIVEVLFPKWSADGQYIFQLVRSLQTGKDIGINYYDTSLGMANSTRLYTTANNTFTVFGIPAPSTVGAKICFLAQTPTGNRLLVSDASLAAPNAETIGNFPITNCEWNQDASRVLSVISNNAAVSILEIQALDPENLNPPISYLTNTTDTGGLRIGSERWRPGSNDEVSYQDFVSGTDTRTVFLKNANSDTLDLGLGSAEEDTQILDYQWSTDGSSVVYGRYFATSDRNNLFSVIADGSNTLNLTDAVPENDRINQFHWSQDSSHIIFDAVDATDPDPNRLVRTLYSVSLDGQEPVEITGRVFNSLVFYGYQPKPE